MQRALRQAFAAGLALGALAIGAAALERIDPGITAPLAANPATGPTLFETLMLHQYGHGALDWLLPNHTGDRNDRDRKRAG